MQGDTKDWGDDQFIEEITSVYNQVQAEYNAYETVLVDYRPASKAAKEQFQKNNSAADALFYASGIVGQRSGRLRAADDQRRDAHKSPKVIAVLDKIKQIRKALGTYSSDRLPATPQELKRFFAIKLELEVSVRDSSAIASSSRHKAGDRLVKTLNGTEFAFRYSPAGTFMMGSPEEEKDRESDETQHKVTLTNGFWMMETEVTQKQW